MGFLRQLSECCLRVLAQHANNALSMGTSASQEAQLTWRPFTKHVLCFALRASQKAGCSILLRAKLVWILFWAVAKEYLARRATTAMPEKKSVVKLKNNRSQVLVKLYRHCEQSVAISISEQRVFSRLPRSARNDTNFILTLAPGTIKSRTSLLSKLFHRFTALGAFFTTPAIHQ